MKTRNSTGQHFQGLLGLGFRDYQIRQDSTEAKNSTCVAAKKWRLPHAIYDGGKKSSTPMQVSIISEQD